MGLRLNPNAVVPVSAGPSDPPRMGSREAMMQLSRALTLGTAAALAAALGLAGCAARERGPGDAPPEAGDDLGPLRGLPAFGALDADDDGAISSGEIDAAPESLAALDANGDGGLSAAELRRRRGGSIGGPARTPQEATAAFLAMDADGDGALAATELGSQFQSLLARADADGDGAASEAEILALMTAEAEGPADREQGEAGGREAAPPGAGGEGRPPRPAIPLMAALDADGDGAVSGAELASAAQALRALDGDGDGRLTPDELRPAAGDD